jgi:toxin ParE1/3/4
VANYKLSTVAKQNLIRIHQYGLENFGTVQADAYIDRFFEYFETIAENPFAFESVDFIKENYRRCVCGSDSIFYRLNKGEVEIMAIIGRQDTHQILK